MTPISSWNKAFSRPFIIAGPCSAESEEQVMQTAKELSKIDEVKVFRAGIWKPRTRPGCFEGIGGIGLPWLKRVKNEFGLLTATEVASSAHVELALKHDVDLLWIGARTTVNPFLVQEIADALKGTDIPVLVKNPISSDLPLWLGAIERFEKMGVKKIGAIHRGFFSDKCKKYRNEPMWRIPIELKRQFPDLPLLCDPSHITGDRELINEVSQMALDMDMDGLMVETHINPDCALSDASQQVTPSQLQKILSNLSYRQEYSQNKDFKHELEELRSELDRLDHQLIEQLFMRMKVVKAIGNSKKKNNVTALQKHRMDELMNERRSFAKSLGLSEQYVKEIFDVIHEESVQVQTKILEDKE